MNSRHATAFDMLSKIAISVTPRTVKVYSAEIISGAGAYLCGPEGAYAIEEKCARRATHCTDVERFDELDEIFPASITVEFQL